MASSNGLTREFKLDRKTINKTARTVELAFSSETPVARWGEMEVLSHDAGDYDFSRLNDSHPLLLGHAEHDPDSQIGVVEPGTARVDSDKVGRCTVRFSQSKKAEEIFQDVCDGIRSNVSVGYDRDAKPASSEKDPNTGTLTCRYRWMPTHVAIVPVPADTKAGVGRDKPEQVDSPKTTDATNDAKNNMHRILLDPQPAAGGGGTATVTAHAPDAAAIRTTERERLAEITSIADALIENHGDREHKDGGKMREKIRSMAKESIQKGDAINDFKARCMEQVLQAKPAEPVTLRAIDKEGEKKYSLIRGIRSALKQREKGAEPVPSGCYEADIHQEQIRLSESVPGGLGFERTGFLVPQDAPVFGSLSRQQRRQFSRDMQATVFAAGGATVPTELKLPVIELLRNAMVLDKAGIRRMAGLQGNIVIPRQEAAATAYSVAEIAALTASTQILGQIALSPKRVGATENYSRQLVMQASPDAEALIRDDLFKVIALRWDYLGLNGQGANSEPLGILNAPGISTVTFGATPTYIKMVAFETAIRNANVMDPLTYVSTPSTKGSLKTVAEALTGATTIGGAQNAIWKGRGVEEGEVNGYLAIDSNQVPNNQVIAGAFEHLVHAMWGGLEVVVDIYTKAANAEVVITMNTWGDYALRHPQAFCVSTDAGNQ